MIRDLHKDDLKYIVYGSSFTAAEAEVPWRKEKPCLRQCWRKIQI